MYERSNTATGSEIKAQSLKKYSSKDEVTRKWISICKRLNRNKSSRDYNAITIEAISVCELVIENTLKEDFVEGKFNDNINKLIQKGFSISNDEFYRLRTMKRYRNMAAHSTETMVQEIITYDSAKDTLKTVGRLLYRLGMLSEEDIVPSREKLQANAGEVIGETCLLQELIGEGGSGRVFKAYHKRLDLTVAVKEISNGLIGSIDVENEKNMLLSLRNDGIPRIYDIIEDNQTYYLIMDYIEGQTLKSYIEKMGSLPVKAVIRLAVELCGILSYLHEFRDGVIFRDLKPGNIMLDRSTHIHLIDFGISKRYEAKENTNRIYSGTTSYSSPEQLNGDECDRRSDIYSLGGVMYFMAEGHDPEVNGERSYKRSTPEGLINIIEKAMEKDREDRYSSIEEIVRDLEDLRIKLQEINPGCQYKGHDYKQSAEAGYAAQNQQSEVNVQEAVPRHDEAAVNKGKRSKKKLLLIPAAVLAAFFILFAILYAISSYKALLAVQKDGNQQNTNAITSNITPSESPAANQPTGQTDKPSSAQNTAAETDSNTSSDAVSLNDASTTAFNGKVILTATSYRVDGANLIVDGYIQNNYSKEITISPYDIYVMGDNGNKLELDIYNVLETNKGTSNIVPGEKREFEFLFDNYKDSNSLTLYATRIYCDLTNASFKLKLK